jgi:hypothetical protein
VAVAAAVRENVRPPRPSKERGRTKGVRRVQLAFKADQELVDYVEGEAKQEGWSVTTVISDMLATQMELERLLGEKWWDIEADAVRHRSTKASVLADLVAAGLKAKK